MPSSDKRPKPKGAIPARDEVDAASKAAKGTRSAGLDIEASSLDKPLTVATVAARIGMRQAFVYDLIAKGQLPSRRVIRHHGRPAIPMVAESDLERYMDACRVRPTPEASQEGGEGTGKGIGTPPPCTHPPGVR
jgi:hypothetical protein